MLETVPDAERDVPPSAEEFMMIAALNEMQRAGQPTPEAAPENPAGKTARARSLRADRACD